MAKSREVFELLREIYQRKEILFGAFTSKITAKVQKESWEEIFNICASKGHSWTEGKDANFLRRIKSVTICTVSL